MNNETQKPKILIFSLAYAPFIGGAEIAVQEITKRLGPPCLAGRQAAGEFSAQGACPSVRRGSASGGEFIFEIITANLGGKQKEVEKINNILVYRVGRGKFGKYFYPWLALKKAKELHKKNNYQIVWGMLEFWAGWAALKFKEKFPEIKYLLTMQSGDSDAFVFWHTWFWYWRYRQIFTKADYIQVISNWLAKRARKYGYQGKIDLVPNGVTINSKPASPCLPDRQAAGRQLTANNSKEQKNILTVSRLVKKNGVADLIKAFHLLVTHYPLLVTKLIIVGTGPLENKLKSLAQKLGVADKIIFAGKIPYESLGDYYAQANVFCRPSLSEGLGNVFLEAMAAGLPVVATPVGGIPDFLTDGETGWFCEPKNPKSIAEKIQYVLAEKNKEEVAQVVVNAKRMVEDKYTWEKVAEQMKSIFQFLILIALAIIPQACGMKAELSIFK